MNMIKNENNIHKSCLNTNALIDLSVLLTKILPQ